MSLNNECTCKRVLVFPKVEEPKKVLIFVRTPVSSNIGSSNIDLSNYYNKQETDKMLAQKLSTNELDSAIDQALLEAKESGDFKGEKGEQGIQGERGEKGEQGVAGKDGKDGANGISATHSWSGTTLTITSASGTSSANLKGERGEKGEQGERGLQGEQGIQGIQGEKGADGAKGDKGDKGDRGEQGLQGEKGEDGKDGQNGRDGYVAPIINQSATIATIQPNVLNVWGKVETLDIELAIPTDTNIVNEYMVQFTSGATATQLRLPDTIEWMSEPIINANATYQLSIINNLAVIGEFSNE